MSRRFSIAEAPAGKLEENVFERRRGNIETGKFVAVGLKVFNQRNDGLRHARGVDHIDAV